MQPGYPGPGQDPYNQQPPYGQQPGQQPPYNDPYAQPQQPPPYSDPYAQPQQPGYTDPYGQPQPTSGGAQYPTSGSPYPTSGSPYPQYPQQPGYPTPGYGTPPPAAPNNTFGILALVLGVLSLLFSFCCGLFGLLFCIPAIILGVIGMNKANAGQATNKGMALAGLVCGGIGVVIGIAMVIIGQLIDWNAIMNG